MLAYRSNSIISTTQETVEQFQHIYLHFIYFENLETIVLMLNILNKTNIYLQNKTIIFNLKTKQQLSLLLLIE